MSDSSQFLQLPRTPPISLGCSIIERHLPRVRQFDLWSSVPSCVMDRPQAPIQDERFCRLFRAVRDVSAAFAHARLFICSPHSREVVKTVFSRSFEDVNLKKGLRDGNPQVHAVLRATNAGTTADARPEWKALCGRSGEGAGVKRRVRGPIRRRPYNRGEIITRSRAERSFFLGFYCSVCQAGRMRCCQRRLAGTQIRALLGSGWPSQLRCASLTWTQPLPLGAWWHCLKARHLPSLSRRA